MEKLLLNEFLIKKYGENYTVVATDKAYELLGLGNKEIKFPNGRIVDAIDDKYYRFALVKFLSSKYSIDGLVRKSCGNNHDEIAETEVIIFNNGGLNKDTLNQYRTMSSSLYEGKPDVIDKSKISDTIIESWSKEYNLKGNGEDCRLVYCSYNDNSEKCCFAFKPCFGVGTAGSKPITKGVEGYTGSEIYLHKM